MTIRAMGANIQSDSTQVASTRIVRTEKITIKNGPEIVLISQKTVPNKDKPGMGCRKTESVYSLGVVYIDTESAKPDSVMTQQKDSLLQKTSIFQFPQTKQ